MGVEPTRWTPNELIKAVADVFCLKDAIIIRELHGGISNCYLLDTPEGRMVLKEIPSWFSRDEVLREPDICGFLKGRGVPVGFFRKTGAGSYCLEHKGRLSTLQTYIDGAAYAPNQGPWEILDDSAATLGRIHRELKDYPRLPEGMGRDWFDGFDADASIRQYGVFMRDNLGSFPEEVRDKVAEEIRIKIDLLRTIPGVTMDFDGLTRLNTHGDYKIQNMIFDGDHRVKAVLDFSGCVHPIVWEVLRSYAHADPGSAGGDLDIAGLVDYCGAYLRENPGGLSGYDMRNLVRYWLMQLLRANYHGEYLSTEDVTAREEALRFAGWSTRVCQWLYRNESRVVSELLGLLA